MSTSPRLSIGLPVYNGAAFLARSIEALLGQTYQDFELIISDNASTDGTAEICRTYEKQDSRIRYIRQAVNLGSAANHNVVVGEARGELFKWAAHDDLYHRELLRRCVDALDAMPDVVLAHSWTAMIDDFDQVTFALEYPLATNLPRAPQRFRSVLFVSGGDDLYGVMRLAAVRPALNHGSHHHADRTLVAALSLYGPFYSVPEWLYFRRGHAEADGRQKGPEPYDSWPDQEWPVGRAASVSLDPRRANRWLHPAVRLYGEYVWGYVTAIRRAPLSPADRFDCFRYLAQWAASRSHLRRPQAPDPVRSAPYDISVDAAVAGREKRK